MTGARRPVIGIVGTAHEVVREFGTLPVHGTPRAYVAGLLACGARPVILPPGAGIDLLDVLDGLVLAGGGDIAPERYGAPPGTARGVVPERDEEELALAHAALATAVPLLGVCRGMQVLAVAGGGRLRNGVGHEHPAAGHPVTTAPGSTVHGLVGHRPVTSALHQQAVADPGPAWVATAWSDDGEIEAIEPVDRSRTALGVQWHPELFWNGAPHDRTGPEIFGWLVGAARNRSTGRMLAP